MVWLMGATRQAASRQFMAEQVQIVGHRFVEKAMDERGELLGTVDIGGLGRAREAAQGHVVDQALAQRAGGNGLGRNKSLLLKVGRVIARPGLVERSVKPLRYRFLAFSQSEAPKFDGCQSVWASAVGPYVLVPILLIISVAAYGEEGTMTVPGPVQDHFLLDLRACATAVAPTLLPDIAAGLEFREPGWPANHAARRLFVCLAGKGWNRHGPIMMGGGGQE